MRLHESIFIKPFKKRRLVLEAGLEPAQPQWPRDFKSLVSTDSTIRASFQRRAENETRTRDPNLGKVMLYQLSYFRIFSTGAKIMSFLVSAKLSIKKVWQKIFYRPNNAFSACSIPQKLKPSTTCCINAEISSLQRLPILPSCV